MIKFILCSLFLIQVNSLPRTNQGKIDWSKIEPKYVIMSKFS